MILDQIIVDMNSCMQSKQQSIYEHGLSVNRYLFDLLTFLDTGVSRYSWNIPSALLQNKQYFLSNLAPLDILNDYTIYHDIGKPYCVQTDDAGVNHFPNHATVSYKKWVDIGGSERVANLILNDMLVHTMCDKQVFEFVKIKDFQTLLLVGLSELHSNADMFGGIESVSFKIKYKKINRRFSAICRLLLKECI